VFGVCGGLGKSHQLLTAVMPRCAVCANNRGSGLGGEVRRRILMGTYALSAGYYDAYYKRAQQVREAAAAC
jgi:Asp-tRNA(Asn)/Glu-tRNA(Gln) amidotransferase A subunit family amidase